MRWPLSTFAGRMTFVGDSRIMEESSINKEVLKMAKKSKSIIEKNSSRINSSKIDKKAKKGSSSDEARASLKSGSKSQSLTKKAPPKKSLKSTKVSGLKKAKLEEQKKSSIKSMNPLKIQLTAWTSSFEKTNFKFEDGDGKLYLIGEPNHPKVHQIIDEQALDFQKSSLMNSNKELIYFQGLQGPVWIFSPSESAGRVSHGGRLEESYYAKIRDQVGSLMSSVKSGGLKRLAIELVNTSEEQENAFYVGANLWAYNYKSLIDGKGFSDLPQVYLRKEAGNLDLDCLQKAEQVAVATNLSRHLVNLPPNYLNPSTMVNLVHEYLAPFKTMSVEVWDEKRLEKEGMGLHLSVGRGGEHPPCLIRIRYRPKSKNTLKPIAFVGKGITFDTGGYDIKPSSGMRLMKKDMGGSACIMGLALWTALSHYHRPMDFYLAMAENMIDAKSFRPSDVVTARNGMKVEIHNTDAEGRLVLADALDVAVTETGVNEPQMVINVATLTGAIKVALGADISGLFSNDDSLAEDLNEAGYLAGELNWRMPLFSKYNSGMSSPFADVVNAIDGFGGAITAALFLEKFVKNKPWAHLDIYAWNDRAGGALTSPGGNGQGVQSLVQFLQKIN